MGISGVHGLSVGTDGELYAIVNNELYQVDIADGSTTLSHTLSSLTDIEGTTAALDVLPTLAAESEVSNAGTTVQGEYGTLTLFADGSYRYLVDQSLPQVNNLDNGDRLLDVFTYSAKNDEGGESWTTLTVTINGTTDVPVVETGTTAADTYYGRSGHDTLLGEEGADLLFGGMGNDTLEGDDGQVMAVNISSGFISQASQVTLPAATGLKGEFYETSTVFSNLSQAVSLVTDTTPKATFNASSFNYSRSGSNLSGFLGSDASSLTGHGSAADQTFALKMTGYIRLTAGTHDFNVASDDGFRLRIGGDTVTEFTAPRGVATSSGNFTAAADGLYEVELIYWQGNGGANLDISSTSAEPFQFYEILPAGAETVDGQNYFSLPTPDITVDVASGVSLSAGTNNGDGTWTLKGSELNGLTMTGTGNNWDDSLTFTASKETNRTVAIGDASFESVGVLGDGNYVHNPGASSWTFSGGSNGIHDYKSSSFNDQSANGSGEQATHGYNAGFINSSGGTISQTLSENFDRNTTYELSVDIGNLKDSSGFANYEVRIKAGGVTLVSDGSVTPAEGEFETLTVSLDGSSISDSSAAIGQPLVIELFKQNGTQVAFDNVRMTATTTEQVAQETVNTDQSDQITGGTGDDILTGGNDSDTFVWNTEDLGTTAVTPTDTIRDFQVGQNGDVLDLSDVLTDDSEPLDSYLSLNFENGDTTIEVKPAGDSDVTQKIKLEGVDLSTYGNSDSEILTSLIDDGNLQIE